MVYLSVHCKKITVYLIIQYKKIKVVLIIHYEKSTFIIGVVWSTSAIGGGEQLWVQAPSMVVGTPCRGP